MFHLLVSRFSNKQWPKLKCLAGQEILLVDNLFTFLVLFAVGKYNPWFSANGGESTDASAVELVAPPGAQNLKVEGLIKLTQFL